MYVSSALVREVQKFWVEGFLNRKRSFGASECGKGGFSKKVSWEMNEVNERVIMTQALLNLEL